MTLLPHENRDVTGLEGPQFPRYKVGPICSNPTCSRFADHPHHLWRRSALGGPFHWVELWDHTILGNVVGLCWRCHNEVTEGRVWMRWAEADKKVVWDDNTLKYPPRISPHPPLHGEPYFIGKDDPIPEPGPAASDICPGCKRPIKKVSEPGEREQVRRRKTWTVTVPDDGEDGALVLDTLIDGCRELFSHGDDKNVRYFTLVQALALVVQHGHLLISENAEIAGTSC